MGQRGNATRLTARVWCVRVCPATPLTGYNLDYNEAFREMPHICIISGAGIAHFKSHPMLEGLL